MEATVSYLLVLLTYSNSNQKNSEINDYALFLGNVSKDFIINNMKKTGWKGVVKYFSIDFNPIGANDNLDIHKYLMKRTWYKIMSGLIKNVYWIINWSS